MSTYLKHTFIYFISKGLPGALSFFAILYYSNKLEPSQYGIYSLIISAVGILNIIGYDWFRFGVARFLPEYIASNKREEFIYFVRHKVQITLAITLLLVVLCYFIYPLFSNLGFDRWFIPVVGLLASLQYLFILFTRIIITELRPKVFMMANFIKTFSGVLTSLCLVYLGYGFIGLLIGLGLGLSISNLFLIIKIKFPFFKFQLKFKKALLKQIAIYSIPMAASAGLSFILSYSNRFIINHYRGVDETGLFSLGFDFSQQTVGVFISIAATSAFPIAMKLYTEYGNSDDLKKHMNNSLVLLCMITLPVVAIFGANSHDISTLFLGDKFSSLNKLVIPVISLSAFILGIKSFYFDLYFYLIKETKYQLLILFLVAATNVVLNIVFVPIYGYIAAIWVGLLTSIIAVGLTFIVTNKLLPIKLNFSVILKIFIIACVMFAVMKGLGNTSTALLFSLKVFFGIVIYLVLISILERKRFLLFINSKFKK